MTKFYRLFLALSSGILLTLAFPRFDLHLLAWFALVPLLFALKEQGFRSACALGYIAGLSWSLGLVYWVGSPTEVKVMDVLLIVGYLAIYGGLFGIAFSALSHGCSSPLVLTVPIVWVALEYIRAHFFFLEFPWMLLGHSQYQYPALIQMAAFTGVYGISFLIMTVNVAVFEAINSRLQIWRPLMAALVLVALSTAYGQFVLSTPVNSLSIPVTVIPGNTPQEIRWDPTYRDSILAHFVQATKQAVQRNSTSLIIWPETAVPGDLKRDVMASGILRNLARETNAPLLVGNAERAKFGQALPTAKKHYNSAFLVLPEQRALQSYHKMKLLPFGEYLPLKGQFPWPSRYISQATNYLPGEEYVQFSLPRANGHAVQFSALICWETIFADFVREFPRRGAMFLVAMSNEAWFRGTPAPAQLLTMNVFRAVENRRAVVRSVNGGISGLIDPYGRIIATLEPAGDRPLGVHLTQLVPLVTSHTFYTLYGDVFAAILTGFACAFMLASLLRPHKAMVMSECT